MRKQNTGAAKRSVYQPHGLNEFFVTIDDECVAHIQGYDKDIKQYMRDLMDEMGYDFYKHDVRVITL